VIELNDAYHGMVAEDIHRLAVGEDPEESQHRQRREGDQRSRSPKRSSTTLQKAWSRSRSPV
jgi:hypothetical protein